MMRLLVWVCDVRIPLINCRSRPLHLIPSPSHPRPPHPPTPPQVRHHGLAAARLRAVHGHAAAALLRALRHLPPPLRRTGGPRTCSNASDQPPTTTTTTTTGRPIVHHTPDEMPRPPLLSYPSIRQIAVFFPVACAALGLSTDTSDPEATARRALAAPVLSFWVGVRGSPSLSFSP